MSQGDREKLFMSSDSSTCYTRDILTQMSDKQIDDAASKLKRLIRETEKRIAATKSKSESNDTKSLQSLEVEYCYVDDERQRRQRFNENRQRRRNNR